jgi:1-acyl-sn-glycerol-3-phosphate acyltransferase
MFGDSPLIFSQSLLAGVGTRVFLSHENRIPRDARVIVVSNHRSFMDAPILMAALNEPIRFACHHYMGQVPGLRQVVTSFGAFPLEANKSRQQHFFKQASQLLQGRQKVGVFPEGAQPMVQKTSPDQVGRFHRGFAHLALRTPVEDLAVLPVAIASRVEEVLPSVPVRLLSLFDPSEPMFQREGWHPVVIYKRVNVLIGHPIWIQPASAQNSKGKLKKAQTDELVQQTYTQITDLLHQGCY